MKYFVSTALLLGLAASLHLHRPFKLGGVTIDFDENPDLTDPVDIKKNFAQDQDEIKNIQKEIDSANRNAQKGSELGKQYSQSLVLQIKAGMMQVAEHLEQEKEELNGEKNDMEVQGKKKDKADPQLSKSRLESVEGFFPTVVQLEQNLGMIGPFAGYDQDAELVSIREKLDSLKK